MQSPIRIVALGSALTLMLGLPTANSVRAQEAPPVSINADGADIGAGRGANATNDGGNVVYGDISSDNGYTIIESSPGPAPIISDNSGGDNARRAAPVRDTTTDTSTPPETASTGETSTSDSSTSGASGDGLAAPTAGDQDADNYADADEAAAGLDPTNPDTDEDGVADGDEAPIYGTDPTVADTDGDGRSDGKELFWDESDPTVPDEPTARSDFQDVPPETSSPNTVVEESTVVETSSAPGPVTQRGPVVNATSPGVTTGNIEGPTRTSRTPPTVIQGPPAPVSEPAPPVETAPEDSSGSDGATTEAAAPVENPAETTTPVCADYGDWYTAQTNYENAGGVDASTALVDSLDPDRNGIACESMME